MLKPDKDIAQDGNHITIKTLSTFKNYNMEFEVGKEFEEDLSGIDDRKCMVGLVDYAVVAVTVSSITINLNIQRELVSGQATM